MKTYYTLDVNYKGFSPEKDDKVAKILRRKSSDGSGYDFISGRRDLSFHFNTKRAVKNAILKIRATKMKLKLEVFIEGEDCGDWQTLSASKFLRMK